MVLEVGDELLAVPLRTCGHRASPYDEEVGVGVFFRELPPAGEVVGFHLERLGLVESATECLKAHFHVPIFYDIRMEESIVGRIRTFAGIFLL